MTTVIVTTPEQLRELIAEAVADALAQMARTAEPAPALVDVAGMARILQTSRPSVYRLIEQGAPHMRLLESYRFEPAAVLAWLKGPKPTKAGK